MHAFTRWANKIAYNISLYPKKMIYGIQKFGKKPYR